MDSTDSTESGNACERCGKRTLTLVGRRIAKISPPGYVDFFGCEICGHLIERDVQEQPPKD